MNRHYIASGFFNEKQMNRVLEMEDKLKRTKQLFFSPRTITMDLSPNNPDRIKNCKEIFRIDTEEIENSNIIDIILDEKMDIGTLFELGYALGLRVKEQCTSTIDIQLFDHDIPELIGGINLMIKHVNENLKFIHACMDILKSGKKPMVLVANNSIAKDALGMNFIPAKILSVFHAPNEKDEESNEVLYALESLIKDFGEVFIPVMCTDDHPWWIYVMMGILNCNGVKYYTGSFKKYGSNVMIACSSEGHVDLNPVSSMFDNHNIE